ncbi:MAG: cell division protein FtsQ/DivIB [Solirubrobacterales bacterium]
MPSRTSTPAAKRRAASRKPSRTTARRGHGAKAPRAKPSAARASAKTPRPKTKPAARRGAVKRSKSTGRRPAGRAPAKLAAKGPKRSIRTYLIIAALVLAGLAAAYFLWFRSSSLVAVTEVEVSGLSSPQAAEIEDALTKAATSMSTLNLDEHRLERAVAGFPTVVAVSADPDLPHGLAIEVTEDPPVLLAAAKGESVPVRADGVLLRGVELGEAAKGYPVLEVSELPEGDKLSGEALAQAIVLGGAPAVLRPLIEAVSLESERGVEVMMKGGIPVRFGSAADAEAKWAAAAAVLADPKLETLSYVDVRVPERPAVGGAVALAPTEAAPETTEVAEPEL